MTLMRVTFGAMHFRAAGEPAVVFFRFDMLGADGLPEGRPAGAGLKLRVGRVGRFAAAHAGVHAFAVMVCVHAGERALSAVFAGDFVLLRRQFGAPFSIGFMNFFHGANLSIVMCERCHRDRRSQAKVAVAPLPQRVLRDCYLNPTIIKRRAAA